MADLRTRLAEAEEVLRAIRNGEVDAVLVTGAAGEQVYTLTEQKLYGQIVAAKAFLGGVINAIADPVFVKDDQRRYVLVNDALCAMVGRPRAALLGEDGDDLFPAEQVAVFRRTDAGVLETGAEDLNEESLSDLSTGAARTILTRKSRYVDPDGARFLTGVIRDISEGKQAEESLRASEESYRRLFDASPDGIVLIGTDGRIASANNTQARMYGHDSPAQLIGTHATQCVAPPSRDYAAQIMRRRLSGEQVPPVEYELVRRDGTTFFGETSARTLHDAGGAVAGYVCVTRDITDRKRAEADHEKLSEQLRMSQKMEAIGSLAGGIAHDFNNLLSVILSYTGFAISNLHGVDPLRDDLVEVQHAGERAAALTRQLLAFSRRQILQPVTLSLNQIATGIEKMLRRILGEDIDLVQVLAPDLAVIRADEGQMEQVLMNLVVNARDAMPQGGKLTIETSNVDIDEEYATGHAAVKPGPYIQLSVTDTGCGMDAATRARIFEPFFTTKEPGKGTGLGLSTVYGIVTQCGGHVWVYSEPGKGTSFKVYLPRATDAMAAATTRRRIPRLARGTETILVVEDEDAVRKVAVRTLGAAGYTVLSAANGAEALLTHAQHVGDIQLLLTDVVMPRMSGRELAQELCGLRPTLKVLYMSGYTDDAILHHGVLDPGTHFLGKPFSADGLTGKVREVLDEGLTHVADGPMQAAEDDAEAPEHRLDQDALRAFPPPVLAELRQAVVAARYDDVVALVEIMRSTAPGVATELRRMAARYDSDGLLKFLNQ
jgi:PAS domain S-box-containing protein